ncbi:MAG: GNAT family N-acetyltransferase [Desulfobacterales bacterium]
MLAIKQKSTFDMQIKGIKMETCSISFLEKGNISEASRVLSKAMLEVPIHVAIFQGHGEKERDIIEKMFFELLTDLPGVTFLARIKKQIVGVMRMKSCDGSKISDEHMQVEDVNSLDWRKSHWHNEWARRDPSKQHWHLGPVGVLPSHQGKGIGTKLLSRFCKEVEACAAPAYLETDTDTNVRLYERFGFQVVAETEILEVNNYFMWRHRVA